MSETVKYSVDNKVAKLVLNRPEVFNSFNREMALAVQERLDEAEANEGVRCILLTAEGKAFCAGQDLQEAIDDNDLDIKRIVNEHYNPMIRRLRKIEKPILCAVNGVAAGAGASVALACDIVIAAKSATFIEAFSKIGLIPDSGGTFYLPRLIGMQKAAAITFLADNITADEAVQMNLIYRSVDDENFAEETIKLTTKLAKLATKGIGYTKRLLNASWDNTLDEQLEMEMELQYEATLTHDYKEGVAAFLEKRKPEFKGE